MKLSFSLSFNGDCEAAFRFYERCFDGKILFLLRWGDSPMAKDAPEHWKDKVLHATLSAAGATLMGCDPAPGTYVPPSGFSITLGLADPAEAERLFQALAGGGTVRMPLRQTFWALRFGVVTDRFGVTWDINCENPG